jgi:hypothetical protein
MSPIVPYPIDVEPGDFFVVNSGSELAGWIQAGEALIDGKGSPWTHAGMASRWDDNKPVIIDGKTVSERTLYIVQAEPNGAVEVEWYWGHCPHLWSTKILPSCATAALAALGYAGYDLKGNKVEPGVGYAYLDYVAIAAHRYSLHPIDNILRSRIASNKHMICSQLVDQCRLAAGSHLFADGRWPGYVTPASLGFLLS